MKPSAHLAALVVILVAAAACNSGPARPGADSAASTNGTTSATGSLTNTEAMSGSAAASASGDEATAQAVIAKATEKAGPTPTPNATSEAIAKNFKLPQLGPDEPLVVIFEFSDYMCPFCREFVEKTEPQIIEDYVNTGKVSIRYWDFPIPSHGLPALVGAEAAQCAGESGKYWEMHDLIFAEQDKLVELNSPDEAKTQAAVVARFVDMGAQVGVERALMKECLDTQRYRSIVLSLGQKASETGVTQTPTLVISTKGYAKPVIGFVSYEEFKPLLDNEISRAQGTPVATDTPVPTPEPTKDVAPAAATKQP